VEIWRKGLEGSYRLGISISGHRYQMLFAADINSGGVRMDQRQALEMNFFSGFAFLFAHRFALLQLMGQARPGSGIGLLDSPTGSSLPLALQAATKQITAKAPEPC